MKENENRQEGSLGNKKIIITILLVLIVLGVLLFIIFNRNIKYDIVFETNGGSLVETFSVDKNGTITKPEDPVRENYVFAGWYYNDELYDFNKQVTSDMKLEARWVEIGRVAGVNLDKTQLTLYIGDTTKLLVTITPENAANKTVTWVSSNPSVVSVDTEGNVKALKEGKATITVTTQDGNFTVVANVTVKAKKTNETVNEKPNEGTTNNGNTGDTGNTTPPTETVVNVTGVTLDKTTLTLTEGGTSKLTATVNPSNANNKNVTWVSSNSAVATVDASGNVTGVKPGTATITVTTADGGYAATCQVTVNEKPASYSVTFKEIEQLIGDSLQYEVIVKKNGVTFSEWKGIKFNNINLKNSSYNTIPSEKYEGITSATIDLKDGTTGIPVTVYK